MKEMLLALLALATFAAMIASVVAKLGFTVTAMLPF
jgi:hypothetical protein